MEPERHETDGQLFGRQDESKSNRFEPLRDWDEGRFEGGCHGRDGIYSGRPSQRRLRRIKQKDKHCEWDFRSHLVSVGQNRGGQDSSDGQVAGRTGRGINAKS